MFLCCRNDLLCGDHHPHIHNIEVVALEHHRDNVLADVVHIAFDRGKNHLPLGLDLATGGLLRLNKWHKVGHGGLHHTSGFHHLGQEHLAFGE